MSTPSRRGETVSWRDVTREKDKLVEQMQEMEQIPPLFVEQFQKTFKTAAAESKPRQEVGLELNNLIKVAIQMEKEHKGTHQKDYNTQLAEQREEYNRELRKMQEEFEVTLAATKQENASLRRDLQVVVAASQQMAEEEDAVGMKCHELVDLNEQLETDNEELVTKCHELQEENLVMKRDMEALIKSMRELGRK